MGSVHGSNLLIFFLASLLSFSLLTACDSTDLPIQPPETRTISGKVLDMPLMTPVANATLEVVCNNVDITNPAYRRNCDCPQPPCPSTTSDEYGRWIIEDLPLSYNPDTHQPYDLLIKVTVPSSLPFPFSRPPAHNIFTLSLGDKSDMMSMNGLFYLLFALISGADTSQFGELCLMLGAAIGFSDLEYPAQSVPIEGVTVRAAGGSPPQELPILYLGEQGLPDTDLDQTSSMGAFLFYVPDAQDGAMPAIDVTGTKPGVTLIGGYYPACPGSFSSVGVIDPFYNPNP